MIGTIWELVECILQQLIVEVGVCVSVNQERRDRDGLEVDEQLVLWNADVPSSTVGAALAVVMPARRAELLDDYRVGDGEIVRTVLRHLEV